MHYRTLGSSGIRVSEIGFGAWGIGGNARGAVAYGPTNDSESQRAIHAALDRGVNFFDTADFYGFGHSEEVLGAALRGARHTAVIASKGGMVDALGAQDFSPPHLAAALEGSLRRLQTDYLDLYQLHSPALELLQRDSDVLETLRGFQRAGKVRAIGISARSPDEGLAAVRDFGIACVQVNFNLMDQRALDNGLFDICARTGTAVIVRTPLCFGFLTGKYDGVTSFDGSDHRSRWSPAQRQRWAEGVAAFTVALGDHTKQTPAQIALRFCLSYAPVSTVIPGMLTVGEVNENCEASELGVLPEEALRALRETYRGHEFFIQR